MPLRPNMTPAEFLEVFLRRKWFVIFSFLMIFFGASVYCVLMPELYRSSTTIMVVPQRVPENYVRTTVTSRIEDRLGSIRQQVLSRTRLIAVMDELGLFQEEKRRLALDTLVEEMRKRISIEVRQNEAFTLSFVHGDPKTAMLTTSRLASLFIDENLKTREQQAVGTADFLESQLQETKKMLEVQEERVKQYKSQFMNELPQQLPANLQILARLQEQQRSNSDAFRSARDRRVILEAQLHSMEPISGTSERPSVSSAAEPSPEYVTLDPTDPAASLVAELSAKQAQLATLSSRYTDRYPEIRRLRDEVLTLERRITEVRKGSAASSPQTRVAHSSTAPTAQATVQVGTGRDTEERRRFRELREQLMRIEVEIKSLDQEKEQIRKSINAMEAKLEKAPSREQDLIALTRDYENIKRSYDELLGKKLSADVAQNLEKRQKGEQFQILDPADLPEKPFIPNRPKVFGLALAAALMIGLGGCIGFEMADPAVRNMNGFRQFSKVPVLASIPMIPDVEYNRKLALRSAAILGGILFTAALTVFLLLYTEKVRHVLKGVG